MGENNTCRECKFCVLQDTGYSNYTVMGAEFYCLKHDDHGNNGDDIWGLELDACDDFSKGDSIKLDVDGEVEYLECDLESEVWGLYVEYVRKSKDK